MSDEIKKLYKITLHGLGRAEAYVVAVSIEEAAKKVCEYFEGLEKNAYIVGEIRNLEYLAECGDYPKCTIKLFL